jgi:hypothetical protein
VNVIIMEQHPPSPDDEMPTSEEPFAMIERVAPTDEERLDLYRIYREMGGAPYEPNESQFQARHAANQSDEERKAA